MSKNTMMPEIVAIVLVLVGTSFQGMAETRTQGSVKAVSHSYNNWNFYYYDYFCTAQPKSKTITGDLTIDNDFGGYSGDGKVRQFYVTNIGDFSGCSGLTSLVIKNTKTTSDGYSVVVTNLVNGAFMNCSSLSSVVLPSTITRIQNNVFKNCLGLTTINLAKITSIGDNAFEGCSALGNLSLGNSTTAIGAQSYKDCLSLTNITFGSNLSSIGVDAYLNTPALKDVSFNSAPPSGVVGSGIFANHPKVTYPISLVDAWMPIFRECSQDLYVTFGVQETVVAPNEFVEVSMSCTDAKAHIYYTLDGSAPTVESIEYTGVLNLTVAEDVTINAVSVVDGWPVDEHIVKTINIIVGKCNKPILAYEGAHFNNACQEVALSCETDGASILYTTDGSDPEENGQEYKHPFKIYKTCKIRAIAVKHGWQNSEETTENFTRDEVLSEAVNLYGYTMETDDVVPWVVDGEVSRDGVSSVRSGAIGNNGTTWLQTSIKKAGTVSFWWKAACEDADEEEGEDGYYDYGAFLVDDVVVARIAGHDGEWHYVSHEVPSGGKHTLKWKYRKDGATSYAPDCVWVDQVQWIPADGSGYTLTTPEPVPYAWLDAYRLGVGTDYETAGNAASGKMQGGRLLQVWQDYVAGTDPTNLTSRFTAKIEMVDGAPVVKWEPDLNTNGVIRAYKVYGKETLQSGGEWQYPTNSLHRFFKVTVEMP